MTTAEAAILLDLPVDAMPEQLEARFLELRRKLEDKIAKAPTPGLQAKYRESLGEITTAFETLTLAADSSTLPVLKKEDGGGRMEMGGREAEATDSGFRSQVSGLSPSKRAKSGGKEFALVALVTVALLGAGGWWVMKSRADRAAELAATKQRQEAEAVRAAEQVRQIARLRTDLATSKVAWDALENRLREAERHTAETKSELRGFRDGPATKKAELSALAHRNELFSGWLNGYLVSHPAKIARARAEQLLSDKLVDEAAAAVADLQAETTVAQEGIRQQTANLLEATTQVAVESQPAGIHFVLTDAYGRTTEGVTPATLDRQPLSHLHDPHNHDAGPPDIKVGEFTVEPGVRFIRPGWKDVVVTGMVPVDGALFSTRYAEGVLQITALPASAPFVATNSLGWKVTGTTPATLAAVPPGTLTVQLLRPGFQVVEKQAEVRSGQTATVVLDQRGQLVVITVAEPKARIFIDRKLVGEGKASLSDLTPGEHALHLEAAGYPAFSTTLTVKQEYTRKTLAFSFKDLATENIACTNCKGVGSFPRQTRCSTCKGTRKIACDTCDGRGWVGGNYGYPRLTCSHCNGGGRETCDQCQDGKRYWNEACTTCGGDGRRSRLQLAAAP